MNGARAWLGAAGQWLARVFWTRRAATAALVVVATMLIFGSAFAISLKQVVLSTPVWTATTGDMLENDETGAVGPGRAARAPRRAPCAGVLSDAELQAEKARTLEL